MDIYKALTAVVVRRLDRNDATARFLHKYFVTMQCTSTSVMAAGFAAGVMALVLEAITLFSMEFLYTIEPRKINLTEDGEQLEALFKYRSGYWEMCRARYIDFSRNLTAEEEEYLRKAGTGSFKETCEVNTFFGERDNLLQLGRASGAIIVRATLSMFLHIAGIVVTIFSIALSACGYGHKDRKSFYACLVYIAAGIVMMLAVLEYICVVDDEMAPRLKPPPDSDKSKYEYFYGWAFYCAALAFVFIELGALANLKLYLQRFPTVADKMRLIPGLQAKLERACADKPIDDDVEEQTARTDTNETDELRIEVPKISEYSRLATDARETRDNIYSEEGRRPVRIFTESV